ncbi:MAG: carbamoyl-phosphate synthase large subunit, partial [Bdellovibrionales bacterium]
VLHEAKKKGFSDARIADLVGRQSEEIPTLRWQHQIFPAYFQVDTCAGEFKSETPYFYSTYHAPQRRGSFPRPLIALLGSGPNRIGQGVEFDYSCVRSVREFQKNGHYVAMINSNPETVSTDYDTSDALFFEPLTFESVLEILRYIEPEGFISQLGGQTPINLAHRLVKAGCKLLGSSLETIDMAEDRGLFVKICQELNFRIPRSGMAADLDEAHAIADGIGYPVICRPSYVLGGRRMEIVESPEELKAYFERHGSYISAEVPCLMDQFLERALEVDVDLVRGPDWAVVGGIIEHIEAAGVHSGDSMGVVPPQRLKDETCRKIEELSLRLADRLGVKGFLNLQLAVKDDEIFMIEANPRSSRSVPFIAKATGIPLVDLGVKGILGLTAREVHPEAYNWHGAKGVSVKGVVFPFKKFPEADSILGPEMKSTGETMGRGGDYSEALLKAVVACSLQLPAEGEVFLSLREKDKIDLLPLIRDLQAMGFSLSATRGTAAFLKDHGLDCESVKKVHEGRPHCVDRIRSGQVAFVINTTSGRTSIEASFGIRRSCVDYSIPCITESDAAKAFVLALRKQKQGDFGVTPL